MNVSKTKKTQASESTNLALTTSVAPTVFVGDGLTRSLLFLQMLRSLAEIIGTAEDDEANSPISGSIFRRLDGQDLLISCAVSDIYISSLDGDSFSRGTVFEQSPIKALANTLTQSLMSIRTKIG